MLTKWRLPRPWFTAALIVVAAAAGALAWFLRGEGRANADQWASIIFGGIGAVSVTAAALTWLWRQGAAAPVTTGLLDAAVGVLARGQREQWTAEQAARRVRDPWPLNVRWLVSPRAEAVMASWASVRGVPGAGPIPLEGSYEQVTRLFDGPETPRRLVVLGEPGAGKSMLLLHLTLRLLAERADTDPVPVLLPVAGWQPTSTLDDWLADRLAASSRLLARAVQGPGGERRAVARELVARGLILPVLDGLDEMDEDAQRAAMGRIAAATDADRQLVVSCRTRPYEAAVQLSGPLPGAAVVELQPLAAREAAQYLVDGSGRGTGKWAAVLAHLAEGGPTPLVRALSTPLTIWLARNVYLHPASDPRELLTAPWARSREGIERHLLEHLIAATYTAAVGGHPARTPEQAERARRFLTVLARHLRAHRSYDLAWWELNEISPGPAVQMAAVLFALPVGVILMVDLVVAAANGTSETALPAWLAGLLAGAAAGVAAAFARLLFLDRRTPRQFLPARLPRTALLAGAVPGLVALVVGGPLAGLTTAVAAGVIVALGSGGSPIPGGARGAAGPTASLRDDRLTGLVGGAVIGGAVIGAAALDSSSEVMAPTDPSVLVAAVVAAGAAAALSAWGQFGLARLALAAARKTPLRLVSALREAHDRGLLRQAGGFYQFRHNLLQDHLAGTGDDPAATGGRPHHGGRPPGPDRVSGRSTAPRG